MRELFNEEFNLLKEKIPEALYVNDDEWLKIYKNTSNIIDLLFKTELANENNNDFNEDEKLNKISKEVQNLLQIVEFSKGLNNEKYKNLSELKEILEKWFYKIFNRKLTEYIREFYEKYLKEHSVNLANAEYKFGEHAYGCYLPMHRFHESKQTPWGIYLDFNNLLARTYRDYYGFFKDKYPEFSLIDVFVLLLFGGTYRHELFHFQVERFATKLEFIYNKPVYKPYNMMVYGPQKGKKEQLEEVLANTSVIKSKFSANITGQKIQYIKETYLWERDHNYMPPGYKDFSLEKEKQIEEYIKLSKQITKCNINADDILLTNAMTVNNEGLYDFSKVPVNIVFRE